VHQVSGVGGVLPSADYQEGVTDPIVKESALSWPEE
jgi:hypothetical protein